MAIIDYEGCSSAFMNVFYKDKILLVHHKHEKYWMAPGGRIDKQGEHVKYDKSVFAAGKREFYEETGNVLPPLNYTIDGNMAHFMFGKSRHYIGISNVELKFKGHNTETDGLHYFTIDEILSGKYPIRPFTRAVITTMIQPNMLIKLFKQNIPPTIALLLKKHLIVPTPAVIIPHVAKPIIAKPHLFLHPRVVKPHVFVNPPVVKPVVAEPVVIKPVVAEPVESKPVETKPVVTEPVVAEPVVIKPVETKPVETRPVETKPVETKPVVMKPVETKPVETKPVETESDVTKPIGFNNRYIYLNPKKKHLQFYNKYLKYKNKYLELKNSNNQF